MRKILFLVGSYLPNPSPNGICIQQIIDELIDKGDDVTCIAYAEHNFPLYEKINGTHIYRLNRNWIDRLLSYCKDSSNSMLLLIIMKLLQILKKIKQVLLLPIYPWTEPIYTYKLYKSALNLQRERKFDAVICVHVPLDTLIAGHLLKKKDKSIKYISYFLDSLSGGFHLKILSKEWSINRRIKWEKKLLKNADKNIMMLSSQEHYRRYSKNLDHYRKMIFLDIPLLVKRDLINKNHSVLNSKKINIVYTGSLYYSSRNPDYILSLFMKLNRKDIALTFIGSSDCSGLFKEMKTKFVGELNYYEHMTHDKILDILPKANILLNIGVDNNNAISGKIFEYMSYGKPIISTYSIDNEPCIPYLKKYPLALLIDQREGIDINLEKLNSFIKSYWNMSVPFASVKKEFYRNTPEAFLEVLDSTIGDDIAE